MSVDPNLSVCIPAYNRAAVLPALLDSILVQDFDDYEILICEDRSPERIQIRAVVERYAAVFPGRIRYEENRTNLGYDANIRNLVARARGEYCVFMGNDDIMCVGTLTKIASAIARFPDVGVVLRSYAAFDGTPDNIVQTFRYFEDERYFPPGPATIATMYRRSVVIPGMTLHRETALRWADDRFDGVLLYQLYLVANILVERSAVFLPDVLVLYRNAGVPDFGNSEVERGKFVPAEQTPESSLHFMRGMIDIARHVEWVRGVDISRRIIRDIGNYAYPILALQAAKPFNVFMRYAWALARLGPGRSPLFWMYWMGILLLGTSRIERLIIFVKGKLGYTPALGGIYRGESS